MKSPILITVSILLVMTGCDKAINYTDRDGPGYSGQYSNYQRPAGDSIIVVSYNIQHALQIERSIIDIVTNENINEADIILLQEMDGDGVEEMARRLKYNYIYYPACVQANYQKDFGNAILSKWPMRDFKKIVLPHEDFRRKQKRIAVLATIDVGDREVLACSVHTEFIQTPQKKISQVQHLADRMGVSPEHAIIGGDFNTFLKYTLNSFDEILKKEGLLRATHGIGWTAGVDPFRFPRFNIDHIYSRGFEILRNGKSVTAKASDHIPVWACLKF